MGNSASGLQDIDSLIAEYSQQIGNGTLKAKPYYERGKLYYSLGNFESALQDFNSAIRNGENSSYASKNLETYYFRALTYIALNQREMAYTDFIHINRKQNNNLEPHQKLHVEAMVYLASQENDQALASITQALQLNENSDVYYATEGDCHLAKNHYEDAIHSYSRAIELNDTIGLYYYQLGCAHLQQHEAEAAEENFRLAVEKGFTLPSVETNSSQSEEEEERSRSTHPTPQTTADPSTENEEEDANNHIVNNLPEESRENITENGHSNLTTTVIEQNSSHNNPSNNTTRSNQPKSTDNNQSSHAPKATQKNISENKRSNQTTRASQPKSTDNNQSSHAPKATQKNMTPNKRSNQTTKSSQPKRTNNNQSSHAPKATQKNITQNNLSKKTHPNSHKSNTPHSSSNHTPTKSEQDHSINSPLNNPPLVNEENNAHNTHSIHSPAATGIETTPNETPNNPSLLSEERNTPNTNHSPVTTEIDDTPSELPNNPTLVNEENSAPNELPNNPSLVSEDYSTAIDSSNNTPLESKDDDNYLNIYIPNPWEDHELWKDVKTELQGITEPSENPLWQHLQRGNFPGFQKAIEETINEETLRQHLSETIEGHGLLNYAIYKDIRNKSMFINLLLEKYAALNLDYNHLPNLKHAPMLILFAFGEENLISLFDNDNIDWLSAFFVALYHNNEQLLSYTLDQVRSNRDNLDNLDKNAMSYAILGQSIRSIRYLASKHFAANHIDSSNATPLHWITFLNNATLLQTLFDEEQRLSDVGFIENDHQLAIYTAINNKNYELIQHLIESDFVDKNETYTKDAATYAIVSEDIETIAFFIENGWLNLFEEYLLAYQEQLPVIYLINQAPHEKELIKLALEEMALNAQYEVDWEAIKEQTHEPTLKTWVDNVKQNINSAKTNIQSFAETFILLLKSYKDNAKVKINFRKKRIDQLTPHELKKNNQDYDQYISLFCNLLLSNRFLFNNVKQLIRNNRNVENFKIELSKTVLRIMEEASEHPEEIWADFKQNWSDETIAKWASIINNAITEALRANTELQEEKSNEEENEERATVRP